MNFSTPMLSHQLIENVIIDNNMENVDPVLLMENDELWKKVVEKIVDKLSQPTTGIHFIAGMMIKIPVFPIGFYADGKFMIPFGKYDAKC